MLKRHHWSAVLLTVACAALFVLIVQVGRAEAHHPLAKCEKTYTAKMGFAASRSVYRHPSSVARGEKRQLAKFRRCARSHRAARRMIGRVRWWQEWRVSYKGYWRLAAERLGDRPHAALASLRACESGGRYAYNGGSGYDGAFQYDVRTWYEAQAWRGTPGRYYTSAAWAASVDQQDVVTYEFYYSHRSRWPNCSA